MHIGVYCPKLISLDLSGVALTLKSMKSLTEKCIYLKVNYISIMYTTSFIKSVVTMYVHILYTLELIHTSLCTKKVVSLWQYIG